MHSLEGDEKKHNFKNHIKNTNKNVSLFSIQNFYLTSVNILSSSSTIGGK